MKPRQAGPPALALVGLVGLWEAWVRWQDTAPYVLPAPSRVARAGWDMAPDLPPHIATTLGEALAGLVLGAAVGVAVALALASVPVVRRTLEPLLVASQTVPLIVLAPLLVLWFGFGYTPKVVVVALITFFPVAVSTASGLGGVDPEVVDLVRSMGASSRTVLRTVRLPAAVPAFFAGLRIATAYAVAGAVVGEWVGAERGLGLVIDRARASFRVDRVLVAVAVVTLLSAGLYALIGAIAHRVAPWTRPLEESS